MFYVNDNEKYCLQGTSFYFASQTQSISLNEWITTSARSLGTDSKSNQRLLSISIIEKVLLLDKYTYAMCSRDENLILRLDTADTFRRLAISNTYVKCAPNNPGSNAVLSLYIVG